MENNILFEEYIYYAYYCFSVKYSECEGFWHYDYQYLWKKWHNVVPTDNFDKSRVVSIDISFENISDVINELMELNTLVFGVIHYPKES